MTTKLFSGENVVYTTQESMVLQPPTATDRSTTIETIRMNNSIPLNNINSESFTFPETTTTVKSLEYETYIMKLAKKFTKTERSMTITLPNQPSEQKLMETNKSLLQYILDTIDLNVICVLLSLILVATIFIIVCVMLMVVWNNCPFPINLINNNTFLYDWIINMKVCRIIWIQIKTWFLFIKNIYKSVEYIWNDPTKWWNRQLHSSIIVKEFFTTQIPSRSETEIFQMVDNFCMSMHRFNVVYSHLQLSICLKKIIKEIRIIFDFIEYIRLVISQKVWCCWGFDRLFICLNFGLSWWNICE